MKQNAVRQNSMTLNTAGRRIPVTPAITVTLLLTSVLTIGLCMWGEHYLSRTAGDMQQPLTHMETALAAEDWQRAELLYSSLDHDWQHARRYWLGLGTHQEVADIDTAMLSLGNFVRLQQKEDACEQVQLLRYFIIAPVDGNKLNWSNIF